MYLVLLLGSPTSALIGSGNPCAIQILLIFEGRSYCNTKESTIVPLTASESFPVILIGAVRAPETTSSQTAPGTRYLGYIAKLRISNNEDSIIL